MVTSMPEKEYVAATYKASMGVEGGKTVWFVVMVEPDGLTTCIQTCRSKESCERAVERWNRKEQAAVNRANKKIRAAKIARRDAVDAFLANI